MTMTFQAVNKPSSRLINLLFKLITNKYRHIFSHFFKLEAYNKQQQAQWQSWAINTNNWLTKQVASNSTDSAPSSTIAPPVAPNRPSFCNDNVTTQQWFDGCMVQVRKHLILTPLLYIKFVMFTKNF